MGNRKILVGLTTIKDSNWREKVQEIHKYNIKEIALFPTCLKKEAREELYALLEKSPLKKIPHVHLRSDMDISELDYFVQRWGTEVFNIHTEKTYPLLHDLSKYSPLIFVENHELLFEKKRFLSGEYLPDENELEKWGGLCLDVSHYEDFLMKQDIAIEKKEDVLTRLLKNFRVGCCHISAVQNKMHKYADAEGACEFSCHIMTSLQELDYVKKYVDILPDIVSIELENSLEEQLKAKQYLEAIIN